MRKTKKSAAPAIAARVARTPADIPLARLRPAEWNPRAEITPQSVADLTASVRRYGLIQRVAVVPREGGDGGEQLYTVVAGHRRVEACRQAGLDPVPCDVLDADELTARRLTLLENLQRQDVDPVREAGLVDSLISSGLTIAEIAAETGRSERWAARRRNLVNLDESWRELAATGVVTTDCLERVARYPAELQRLSALHWEDYCRNRAGGPERLRWQDVDSDFAGSVCDLRDATFPRRDCAKCCHNTALQPLLWGPEEPAPGRPAKYGECTNPDCYRRRANAAVADAVRDLRRAGVEIVDGRDAWELWWPPQWSLAPYRSDVNCCGYLVRREGWRDVLLWGQAPAREEDAAADSGRPPPARGAREHLEWTAAQRAWVGEHLAEEVERMFGRPMHPLAFVVLSSLLIPDYYYCEVDCLPGGPELCDVHWQILTNGLAVGQGLHDWLVAQLSDPELEEWMDSGHPPARARQWLPNLPMSPAEIEAAANAEEEEA